MSCNLYGHEPLKWISGEYPLISVCKFKRMVLMLFSSCMYRYNVGPLLCQQNVCITSNGLYENMDRKKYTEPKWSVC